MHTLFKHLDLKEVAGRLAPDRPVSALGRTYSRTAPGQADHALIVTALVLAELWRQGDPDRVIRFAEIEGNRSAKPLSALIPAALKRLAKMKQIKIDFDRDGAFVVKGSSWIEN